MRPRPLLAFAGALAIGHRWPSGTVLRRRRLKHLAQLLAAVALAGAGMSGSGLAAAPAVPPPTGQRLTPPAAPGASFEPLANGIRPDPRHIAHGAAVLAVRPDSSRELGPAR